jgi:hypothetical protein
VWACLTCKPADTSRVKKRRRSSRSRKKTIGRQRRGVGGDEKNTKETWALEQCHIFHIKVVKIRVVTWNKEKENSKA